MYEHDIARAGQDPEFLSRFWARVEKSDGCWEWKGVIKSRRYGQLGVPVLSAKGRARVLAHRAAWVLEHGPIASDLSVCHKCDNPPCVRPDHLFVGTPERDQQRLPIDHEPPVARLLRERDPTLIPRKASGQGGELLASDLPSEVVVLQRDRRLDCVCVGQKNAGFVTARTAAIRPSWKCVLAMLVQRGSAPMLVRSPSSFSRFAPCSRHSFTADASCGDSSRNPIFAAVAASIGGLPPIGTSNVSPDLVSMQFLGVLGWNRRTLAGVLVLREREADRGEGGFGGLLAGLALVIHHRHEGFVDRLLPQRDQLAREGGRVLAHGRSR